MPNICKLMKEGDIAVIWNSTGINKQEMPHSDLLNVAIPGKDESPVQQVDVYSEKIEDGSMASVYVVRTSKGDPLFDSSNSSNSSIGGQDPTIYRRKKDDLDRWTMKEEKWESNNNELGFNIAD
ncbi:MAG: hypothetical protein GY874_21055 [Desulfobacteraceae bacterium]|nr:hypothetical protein [Desulfobacteraceae bacterium]